MYSIRMQKAWNYKIKLLIELVTDCDPIEKRINLMTEMYESVSHQEALLRKEAQLLNKNTLHSMISRIDKYFAKKYNSKKELMD